MMLLKYKKEVLQVPPFYMFQNRIVIKRITQNIKNEKLRSSTHELKNGNVSRYLPWRIKNAVFKIKKR